MTATTMTTTMPTTALLNEDAERSDFLGKLFSFMSERGTSISYIPIFDHRELDLHRLYKAVTARGGLAHVVESKLWRQVTCDLGVDQDRTDAGFRLRMHYLKYLYPYERKFFLKLPDENGNATASSQQQTIGASAAAALRMQHPRTRRGIIEQPILSSPPPQMSVVMVSSPAVAPSTPPVIASTPQAPQQQQQQAPAPQQQASPLSPTSTPFDVLFAAAASSPSATSDEFMMLPMASVLSTPPSHPVPGPLRMTPFVLHDETPLIMSTSTTTTPTPTAPNTPVKKYSKVPTNHITGVTKASSQLRVVENKKAAVVAGSSNVDFNKLDVPTLLRCRHYLLQEAAATTSTTTSDSDGDEETNGPMMMTMTLPSSKDELCEAVAQQFGAADVDEFTAIKAFLLRMGWRASPTH